MTTPKILMDERGKPTPLMPADPHNAWRMVGWFGLLLFLAGFGDFILAFVPTAFGSPEWEFGTVASVFAGLPLTTIGLACLLGSGLARGKRGLVLGSGLLVLLLSVVILVLLVVFLTDVPVALKTVQGEVLLGVKKAIVKTVLLGFVFGVAYLYAGIRALRSVKRKG